jgi:hypothetical protein
MKQLIIARSQVRGLPAPPKHPGQPPGLIALLAPSSSLVIPRGTGLQVQVYAGRDPLTGRTRYVSQQIPGQTKASMREAKQIEAQLLEEVGAGHHNRWRPV